MKREFLATLFFLFLVPVAMASNENITLDVPSSASIVVYETTPSAFPRGGEGIITILFGLELNVVEKNVQHGDNITAILKIENEGDYTREDLSIKTYITLSDDTSKIMGSETLQYKALPVKNTSVSIMKSLDLDPGNYTLHADVKLGEYNKTATDSFVVLPEEKGNPLLSVLGNINLISFDEMGKRNWILYLIISILLIVGIVGLIIFIKLKYGK